MSSAEVIPLARTLELTMVKYPWGPMKDSADAMSSELLGYR